MTEPGAPAPPEETPSAAPEVTLSVPERALLRRLQASSTPEGEEELARATGLAADTARGSLQRLRSKHLALVQEEHTERLARTRRGEAALVAGLPERRLLTVLVGAKGPVDPAELVTTAQLDAEERSVAIGVLRRRGYLGAQGPFTLDPNAPDPAARLPEEVLLAELPAAPEPELLKTMKRRGLLELSRSTVRRWSASEEGRALALPAEDRPQLGALSAEALRTGAWRGAEFRPYDVRAEPPYRSGPEPHPYARFLEEFAEILVGLGFEEAEGPLVETEFWNADVLYMPQEHPARSVHDVFFARGLEGHLPDPALLARVAAAHEGRALPGTSEPLSPGWRAPYREDIARRPVLRSQTTAVSAHYLARRPAAPFRMFCLERNFRPDAVDATHHVEFGQCEGVLGEEGTSLRELVGVFQELASAIGIRELKVRPSYFPFTEPSVEGYVRHPRLGWIEVFPGGLLRPEVLAPLGVDVPVAAWGIGVTRLAMVALGVADIRELFTDDLGRLTGRGA